MRPVRARDLPEEREDPDEGRPRADVQERARGVEQRAGVLRHALRIGAPRGRSRIPNGTTQKGGKMVADMPSRSGHARFPGVPGRRTAKPARTEVYRKDPNHGSPNRPEKPPYDTISDRSGSDRVRGRTTTKLGQSLYAAVPTRAMQVIGAFKKAAPATPPPLVLTALRPFDGTAEIDGNRPLRGPARRP